MRRILLVLLFVFGLPYCGWAENATVSITQQALTLDKAYQLALQNNLEIRAALKKRAEAKADIVIAKTWQNPSLMTDLGFRAEKTYRVAGIAFAVEPPGKRKRRIQVAQAQALQEANIQDQINTILGNVHEAYADWLVAIARLHGEEINVTMLEDIAKVAHSRLKANEVEELDINQAQLLVNDAENKVLSAQSDLQSATTLLTQLLNTPHITPPLIEDFFEVKNLVNTPVAELKQSGIRQRQDLASKTLEAEMQARNVALYKRSRIPSLAITSGFDMVQPMPNRFIGGLFQMGQFEVPIFNRQQGNIAKSRASKLRLDAESFALRLKIESDIQTEYDKLQFLQQEWQRCKQKQLPLARTVDRQALDSYRRGKTSINDVLGQHQNAYSVQMDALDVYQNYQMSTVRLETALSRNQPK